jgi:hypothetical protein
MQYKFRGQGQGKRDTLWYDNKQVRVIYDVIKKVKAVAGSRCSAFNKLSAFYGTLRFITAFTTAVHCYLGRVL